MSDGKKRKILRDVLGHYHQSGNELLFACPKCNHHKNKLSINIERDVYKCWVCDYSGHSIRRVIRAYGNYKQRIAWSKLVNEIDITSFSEKFFPKKEEKIQQRIDIPKEFISLVNKNLPYSSLYPMNYLRSRGISRDDIVRWKIGYCSEGKYQGRIIIPSFNLDGYCNYFIARTYLDDWKRYFNPPANRDIIFNHLYINFDEDITIVEGVFDAIVAGTNSVPLLGSSLREASVLFQEIVKNDTPLYIALDPDAEKKISRLINNFLEYGVEVKKINILPYNDVGEMSKEEFAKRKQSAEIISKDNYLLREIMKI